MSSLQKILMDRDNWELFEEDDDILQLALDLLRDDIGARVVAVTWKLETGQHLTLEVTT